MGKFFKSRTKVQQEESGENMKLKRKKKQQRDNMKEVKQKKIEQYHSLRDEVKRPIFKVIGQLGLLLLLVYIAYGITMGLNQYCFNIYGTGQGNVGKLQIQFSVLSNQVSDLLTMSGDKVEEQVTAIKSQQEVVTTRLNELEKNMSNPNTEKNYDVIKKHIDNYYSFIDQIIRYEQDGDTYSAQSLYTNQVAKIVKEINKKIETLLDTMSDYGKRMQQMALISSIVIIAIIITIVLVVRKSTRKKIDKVLDDILMPIEELTGVAQQIAAGNLNVAVTQNAKNEIGAFEKSLYEMTQVLNAYVEDISSKLTKIAAHDLTGAVEQEYKGDFSPLKESMVTIFKFLNEVFSRLDTVAQTVYIGADQIAASSQNIAEITNQESTSINQVKDGMHSILQQALSNEELCKNANELTHLAQESIEGSRSQMMVMMDSMNKINEASQNISNILNMINDIAEQTNLLALNASIEAARAGESGRGFSVVATEISKLADQCTKAANDSRGMIEETLSAIQVGSENADSTINNLAGTVENIKGAVDATDKILIATDLQKTEVTQIVNRVDAITKLVTTNANTAMENAGVSEELAAQSDSLKSMLETIQYVKVN